MFGMLTVFLIPHTSQKGDMLKRANAAIMVCIKFSTAFVVCIKFNNARGVSSSIQVGNFLKYVPRLIRCLLYGYGTPAAGPCNSQTIHPFHLR